MRIGFLGLLTILFVALKLTEVVAWSWWLVLSPMIAGFVLSIIAILVIVWAQSKS